MSFKGFDDPMVFSIFLDSCLPLWAYHTLYEGRVCSKKQIKSCFFRISFFIFFNYFNALISKIIF
jgi:hypothetical protein